MRGLMQDVPLTVDTGEMSGGHRHEAKPYDDAEHGVSDGPERWAW